MALEIPGYRENLADLLEFFDGKRILSITAYRAHTGPETGRIIGGNRK